MEAVAVLNTEEQAYTNVVKPIFQVMSQKPKLPISFIEYGDLKLEFFKPYKMTVQVEGKYLVHENMKMNMIIHGESLDELVETFFDCFCFLWRDYALADDSELSKGAIEMKQYLLSLAKEV